MCSVPVRETPVRGVWSVAVAGPHRQRNRGAAMALAAPTVGPGAGELCATRTRGHQERRKSIILKYVHKSHYSFTNPTIILKYQCKFTDCARFVLEFRSKNMNISVSDMFSFTITVRMYR